MEPKNQSKSSGSKAGEFLREVREWSIGMVGNLVIRATRQGFWAGAARFTDAPLRITLDGRLFIRLIEQGSQPTTSDVDPHELVMWVDTDTNETYLLTKQNSTIKKVQLT